MKIILFIKDWEVDLEKRSKNDVYVNDVFLKFFNNEFSKILNNNKNNNNNNNL
jgi:hypothetical protein